MTTITEILNDLYKISFRIRSSTTISRPGKSSLYKEVDEETGVDKFDIYAHFDKRHVEESLLQLRKEAIKEMCMEPSESVAILKENVYLIDRLAVTLTERRKVLRYWQRHAKKLGAEVQQVKKLELTGLNDRGQNLDTWGLVERHKQAQTESASSREAKTWLSGTVATEYDRNLDDKLDTQSSISYASTSFDMHGNAIDIPPPPAISLTQTEFLCPYCRIVHPARHAKGRAWRAHVLQDLQPYTCTYPDCPDGLQMYSTRHAWLEHERLVHRRVWQCFEHASAVFSSQSGLHRHLKSQHNDITKAQIQNLLDVSESSLVDAREKCPICLLSRGYCKELDKHMSFHLEKLATFSVHRGNSDEEDGPETDGTSEKAHGLLSMSGISSGTLHFESPAGSIASLTEQATQSEEDEELESQVQVMETRKRTLGPEHPDTLNSMSNLALDYGCQGWWKEAEKLHMQVMKIRMRVLGEEHSDTLRSMSHLAYTYQNQRRWKEVEKLQMQVLETKMKVLGAERSDTLRSMSSLALTYYYQRRWKEAAELQVQVMETNKKICGAQHPDTLYSMSSLARTWKFQGRINEAISLLKDCVQLQTRVLGPKHSHTMTSLRLLKEWEMGNISPIEYREELAKDAVDEGNDKEDRN